MLVEQIHNLAEPLYFPGTMRFRISPELFPGRQVMLDLEKDNGVRLRRLIFDDVNPIEEREATDEELQAILQSLGTSDELRTEAIIRLKQLRDFHRNKGAMLPSGVRIQSDTESINSLIGSITFGTILAQTNPGAPFVVKWSLGNGQSIDLPLSGLIAAGGTLFQHVQTCIARYLALYARIISNEPLERVLADLETGWPT